MEVFKLLDIESGIRSFFSSVAASLSFNLIFILAILIEGALIAFFAVKSACSYEVRTAKSLDKLNQWLFVNKKIGTENIKEFTELTKKCPKRLAYYWQQYILYREDVPSNYMTVENCVEKPLKASAYKNNILNLVLYSALVIVFSFLLGLAHEGAAGDKILNTDMVVVALIIPFILSLMLIITVTVLAVKKNTNLDELYQNMHLFHRFIDNACVDLPAFIDLTLLFTKEEIERGIPALKEYLESRARKEKEEFEKARREAVVFERYNFEDAGVDGSNILERAMNESEAFLRNKDKTINQISQLEASLESLKKNFDNIQKDHQKKLQVLKENIDRLRQQQEETTSRIESNFLRKQQAQEVVKQEKEETDFEQQKRRYLIEKSDYEEEIKNLNASLETSRAEVEKVMLSEYDSFYKRLCTSAYDDVDKNVKDELAELRAGKDGVEDELIKSNTKVKRLEDENLTLRKGAGIPQPEEMEEEIVNDEPVSEEYTMEEPQEYSEPEEYSGSEEYSESEREMEYTEESPKRRGRPVGSTKKPPEEPKEKRGRGRPSGTFKKPREEKSLSDEKRGRGRPKKEEPVKTENISVKPVEKATEINNEINNEVRKIEDAQNEINGKITEVLKNLDDSEKRDVRRLKLIAEIGNLKRSIKEGLASAEIDEIEGKIDALLEQVKNMED